MKKEKKSGKKKKRVNFPWLKKKQTKTLKYFLAYYLDKIGFAKVIRGKLSFGSYVQKKVIPVVRRKFPSAYRIVKKHYKEHGRKLSRKEFNNLIFLRISAMFKYRKGDKKIEKTSEHPLKSKKKNMKCSGLAKLLIEMDKTYEEVK